MKQIVSFYMDTEVIRAAKKEADRQERSLSWLVNSIIRKKCLRTKLKLKKNLTTNKL